MQKQNKRNITNEVTLIIQTTQSKLFQNVMTLTHLDTRGDLIGDELCLVAPGDGGQESPEKRDVRQHQHHLQGVLQHHLHTHHLCNTQISTDIDNFSNSTEKLMCGTYHYM